MSAIVLERVPVERADRAATRGALLAACRAFMQAGELRPPMQACCARAGRSLRTGVYLFGTAEAFRLEAADDAATRDAIVERILGDARAALPDEALCRLVRAVVTGVA